MTITKSFGKTRRESTIAVENPTAIIVTMKKYPCQISLQEITVYETNETTIVVTTIHPAIN